MYGETFALTFTHYHVYAKSPAIAYLLHELGGGASLVRIAAILPELRLINQQYFTANKVPYVQGKINMFRFASTQCSIMARQDVNKRNELYL